MNKIRKQIMSPPLTSFPLITSGCIHYSSVCTSKIAHTAKTNTMRSQQNRPFLLENVCTDVCIFYGRLVREESSCLFQQDV